MCFCMYQASRERCSVPFVLWSNDHPPSGFARSCLLLITCHVDWGRRGVAGGGFVPVSRSRLRRRVRSRAVNSNAVRRRILPSFVVLLFHLALSPPAGLRVSPPPDPSAPTASQPLSCMHASSGWFPGAPCPDSSPQTAYSS